MYCGVKVSHFSNKFHANPHEAGCFDSEFATKFMHYSLPRQKLKCDFCYNYTTSVDSNSGVCNVHGRKCIP